MKTAIRIIAVAASVTAIVRAGDIAATDFAPADSAFARGGEDVARVLVDPIESAGALRKAGWRIDAPFAEIANDVPAKIGRAAVRLGGDAKGAGSKGDFPLLAAPPAGARVIGMWVHLAPDANVDRLGLQLRDGEDEALLATVPVDFEGWKWVEFDVAGDAFAPAYPQKDKNGRVDGPLKGLHVAWFSRAAGRTSFVLDGIAATAAAAEGTPSLRVDLNASDRFEPGETPSALLVLQAAAGKAVVAEVEAVLQRDSALASPVAPDAAHGTDHAAAAKNWAEVDGTRIDEGSLTDHKPWTAAATAYAKGKYTTADQYVDLGQERRVSHIAYTSGDANWAWKLDVHASRDGTTFAPVDGLQGIDLHKKWARQQIDVRAPFAARVIKLHYHNDGALVDAIRMPAEMSVYDGVADEAFTIADVGAVIAKLSRRVEVPAGSFAVVDIGGDVPLTGGNYLAAVKVKSDAGTQLLYRAMPVMPPAMEKIGPDSRFGMNTSDYTLAPLHRRLGIGWVRFENLKWPMVSPALDRFKFDGVPPWNVPHDKVFAAYAEQGISVLPYLFQSPSFATTAPDDKKNHREEYPPRDNAEFADFVFQTVARYGGNAVDAALLKSVDKASAKKQIGTYEIWNEPNLDNPDWGAWVGTLTQYYELFRPAAEAAKRADPNALITNGGYAGIGVELADRLRTHAYADGKTALDFVDVLNVHYYSHQVAPELATINTNIERGEAKENATTYEQDLIRLSDWRDRHKPAMPIWLTETGYDTGGPKGVSERLQAAWLVRDVMLALASGVEKVFVYRETGSKPSLFAASGLIRDDGTLKPAWFTYATLIRALDGTKGGRRLPTSDDNVRLYAFERTTDKGNERVLAAWCVAGTGTLDVKLGACTVVDAFGGVEQRDVNGDLPISEFPVYITRPTDDVAVAALIAAADQQEQSRQADVKKKREARAYLFDFGSREHVGMFDLGDARPFTAVVAADVFDDAKGHGFRPGPARGDESRRWINDPVDRDYCRLDAGTSFAFKADAGRYRLSVGVEVNEETIVELTGAGETQTLMFNKGKSVIEVDVTVGDDATLQVESKGHVNMKWLKLIQMP